MSLTLKSSQPHLAMFCIVFSSQPFRHLIRCEWLYYWVYEMTSDELFGWNSQALEWYRLEI